VVAADATFLQTVSLPSDLPAGNYVCLEVTDSGCGIGPETLPRIFEPFFTTKFAGRGLGLAATAGIIRSHRGTIKVASAPGQGSTFQVLFPCAAIDRGTSEEASGPAPQLGSGTILVVDDEDTVRSLVRTILERAGFVVLEARHGQEGVDVFRLHAAQIALVLLDLTMPQLSGQETLAELRRLRPDIRALLMSGCHREEATERLADLQLAGFIEKPFSATELVAAVQRGLA
jgi:CheY-like chemotaxis protein